MAKAKAAYDSHKAAVADRDRTISAAGRNIGKLHRGPRNQERFDAGRASLEAFLRLYMPTIFRLPFSTDHSKVIAKAQDSVQSGGLSAYAMPRGNGKSSIACGTCLWATLYGMLQFVDLISADAPAAEKLIKILKLNLQWNDLLFEDFEEICKPIREIGNSPQKVPGQLYTAQDGEILNTNMVWNADQIAFPAIKEHPAASAFVMVAGLTGGLRGVTFIRPIDGRVVRPQLVVLDDPQTRESSKSLSQSEDREAIIMGDVLNMAGPDEDIAALMPCTVINKGDLADRFLDYKQHPEWNGTKTRMMDAMPTNMEAWEKYREIQITYDPNTPTDQRRAQDDATLYYVEHQAEMDEGAKPTWPERFGKREVSAVQRAMNLYFRNQAAFFAECQNDPQTAAVDDQDALTPEFIASKFNRLPRRLVPIGCTKLTAGIDVQGSLLYYTVCAFAPDFTGSIIDYGTWPDQRRPYFALREAQVTLADATGVAGLEAQIYAGLKSLTESLLSHVWRGEGGAELRIERCHVDAGFEGDVVKQFCRQSQYAAILTPSHGKGIGAGSNPLTPRKPTEGEEQGLQWYKPARTRQAIKYVIFDSNFWKSFLHARLAVPPGAPGCLQLFGDSAALHRMLADHLTSEKRDKVTSEKTGRTVDEWRLDPGRENHWLDTCVMAHVAGSVQGVSLDSVHRSTKPRAQRERISIDEMKRRARERR